MKRYASYALRLQQDLTREKQKREEDKDLLEEEDARFTALNDKYTGPAASSLWNEKVEEARKDHVAWSRKIDRLVQTLEGRSEAAGAKHSNQVEGSVDYVMQELAPFLGSRVG